jgi:hypothetical protein
MEANNIIPSFSKYISFNSQWSYLFWLKYFLTVMTVVVTSAKSSLASLASSVWHTLAQDSNGLGSYVRISMLHILSVTLEHICNMVDHDDFSCVVRVTPMKYLVVAHKSMVINLLVLLLWITFYLTKYHEKLGTPHLPNALRWALIKLCAWEICRI